MSFGGVIKDDLAQIFNSDDGVYHDVFYLRSSAENMSYMTRGLTMSEYAKGGSMPINAESAIDVMVRYIPFDIQVGDSIIYIERDDLNFFPEAFSLNGRDDEGLEAIVAELSSKGYTTIDPQRRGLVVFFNSQSVFGMSKKLEIVQIEKQSFSDDDVNNSGVLRCQNG